MASPPGQVGSPRHGCCLQCQCCWLWGLEAQCSPWDKARGNAGVWRNALPGISSGHQPPGLLATSFPSLLAFQVLGMDQVLALVTPQEVPSPKAEEVLLTAEEAWLAWVWLCCLILEQASVLHS